MRFDLNFKSEDHLNLYLKILGLPKEAPSLSFLDKLIHAHQHQIPFETHTRVADYSDFLDHISSLPVYIERLELGAGGVCWTLARGFHWLLKNLGFDTRYYYMDPGHVCVIVKLPEGDYYAEVGYAAPFFKAKPLMKSFIATSPLEIFKYDVKGDKIIVTRTPGPTKTLILRPQTPAEINAHFEKLNDPNTSKFLQTLTISKFFNKKIVRLTGDKLIGDGPERTVPEEEIEDLLITKFRIHPSFYQRARTKMK